ncbi:MAG: hypothetical protein GWO02_17305, partial [Gammaproteobacteria bacterium]|nr:hypothetical protein [Gammaproteobacteria bacterium]
HVEDPDALLAEMLRLTRPGGTVVVHDADYASLTFDTGAGELDQLLPARLSQVLFANPFVMREMPRRLRRLGMTPRECLGAVVVEAGEAAYFPGMTGYGPTVIEAGLATREQVES